MSTYISLSFRDINFVRTKHEFNMQESKEVEQITIYI